MSMMGMFRGVRPRVLDAFNQDPSIARLLISYSQSPVKEFVPDPSFLANMPAELRAAVEASAAKQSGLTGPAGTERLAAAGLEPDDLSDPFSIDKAWHGVHFILANTVYEPTAPPGDAVLGGTPVGDDLGYGPVRIKTAQEVAHTSRALAELDLNSLRQGVNPAAMMAAQIYPGGWDATDDSLGSVMDALSELRDFYARSAAAGHAMLLFIV